MFEGVTNFFARVYKKLIVGSHHDAIHYGSFNILNPHKILGFSALAHFLYRYWLIVTSGSAHFSGTSWNLLYLVGHMTLSLSSFLFPVSKSRNFNNQIIWRELQLHNIVFTSRSCAIFAYNIYYPGQNMWTRFAIVMTFHILADLVTIYYKEGTSIRDTTVDNIIVTAEIKPYLDKFYAYSQFGAISYLIIPTPGSFEQAIMIMFAIQLSTFLMTLRLKGIINNDGWHVFYTMSLLMNFHAFHAIYSPVNPPYICAVSLLFYIWRIHFRGNKYLGWFLLIAAYDIAMNKNSYLFIFDKKVIV